MDKKSVVCVTCGRRFATRAAKEQHVRASHGSAPVRKMQRSTPRMGLRRNRGAGGGINTVAPSLSVPVAGSTITVSGTDRVLMVTVPKGASHQERVLINPDVSSRLRALASAYQRIKYNSVRFVVTPQASAIVSGGYVAGFVPDPEDEGITAADLSASQGSITRKWYESAIVAMPRKPDLLYTSEGDEERLVSPGCFWMITEGPPSEQTTVVVTVVWNVTLSVPSVHNRSPVLLVNEDWYSVKDHYYLAKGSAATAGHDFSDPFNKIVPTGDSKSKWVFRPSFSFNIEYKEGTGDTGTKQMHFVVYDQADKNVNYSQDGKTLDKTKWQSDLDPQVLIPKGAKLRLVGKLGELGFRHQLSELNSSLRICSLCDK